MQDFPALISTLGFPIAITCYLLWERQNISRKLEKAIREDLVSAIQELKEQIIIFSERCNGGRRRDQ